MPPRSPVARPACFTEAAAISYRLRTAKWSKRIRSPPGSIIPALVLSRLEGIIPALESAHALAHVATLAPRLPKDNLLAVNLSGRGDKDLETVAKHRGIVL